MAMVNLGGKELEVDEDGFIQDPNQWDENVAKDLAKTEEEGFARIWDKGEARWDEELKKLKKASKKAIDPEFVFKLHDTYGFPVEASRLMAEDAKLKFDEAKVQALLASQRDRSRAGSRISESIFVLMLKYCMWEILLIKCFILTKNY